MSDMIKIEIEVSPRFADVIRQTALHDYERVATNADIAQIVETATEMVDEKDNLKFSRKTAISLMALDIEKLVRREVFYRVADKLGVHPDAPGAYPIEGDD